MKKILYIVGLLLSFTGGIVAAVFIEHYVFNW